MVREVAVEITPAAVLRRVDAHHRVAPVRHGRPVDLQIGPLRNDAVAWRVSTAACWRRGARLPQIGDGETDRRKRRGAGLGDVKRRRQDRIVAAGDLDFPGPRLGPADVAKIVRRASLSWVVLLLATRD